MRNTLTFTFHSGIASGWQIAGFSSDGAAWSRTLQEYAGRFSHGLCQYRSNAGIRRSPGPACAEYRLYLSKTQKILAKLVKEVYPYQLKRDVAQLG